MHWCTLSFNYSCIYNELGTIRRSQLCAQEEEVAVREKKENQNSGIANGENGLKKSCLDVNDESGEEKEITVRRSRSSDLHMDRNAYRRRAIKRPSVGSKHAEEVRRRTPSPSKRHLLASKSKSTTGESPQTLRKVKLMSCPVGDADLNNDEAFANVDKDALFLKAPTVSEPLVSSEDDASTESTSEEEQPDLSVSPIKRPKSFYIARELMTTERTFVGVLKLLHLDFHNFIGQANRQFGQSVIPDDVYNKIFGCFPQLHNLNKVLFNEMEHRIEQWDSLPKISDIIVKHGPFLKIYTTYIKNYSELISDLDEACKKYPLFNDTLRHFELTEQCKKLELRHFMLKPVQRIPQYRLLLIDYLKHIDESSIDFTDTQSALAIVSEVAEHANETMKETEMFAKLLQIQNILLGGHQIVKPGRSFIREGDIEKQCRKGTRWRRFILFNDCLLHCSVNPQGLLKVHHELPLSDMKVMDSKPTESQTEFSVLSVARSFILAASSIEEKEEWMDVINKTITLHEAKRSTFLQAKHNRSSDSTAHRSDERLGQKAPVWIPDSRVTMCQLCMREFTLTFRRHHCRACGKVICSLCSANRAPLFYLKGAARVCYECFHVLQNEIDTRSRISTSEAKQHLDSENPECDEAQSPSIEDLRAQFKQLAPISGDPKKIYIPKVLQEVSANDAGSTISGYLYKKVKRSWKRQWFVVKDKVLYSYKASEDVAALDSTPLLGFKVNTYAEMVQSLDGILPSLLFELHHSNWLSMVFYAENESTTERWLETLRKAVVLE